MKLNKILKNILIVAISVSFVSYANAADTKTIYNYTANNNLLGTSTDSILGQNFHVKYVGNNKTDYSYCLTYTKKAPNGETYTNKGKITDNGVNYILEKSYGKKSEQDFFIYQSALWIYVNESSYLSSLNANKSTSSIPRLQTEVDFRKTDTAKTIYSIYNAAKTAKAPDNTISLKTNTTSLTFTESNGIYKSNTITITTNGQYKVGLTSNVSGTKIIENTSNKSFYIEVPKSSITEDKTISVNITSNKDVYTSYLYEAGSSYQAMAYTVKETLNKNIVLSGKIEGPKPSNVVISKIDASTTKELPGAQLTLKCVNENNKEIYNNSWTSSNESKVLTDVPDGTCTLTENKAPLGYDEAESITFKVVNGKTDGIVVMKDEVTKEPETPKYSVEISKVSIVGEDVKYVDGAQLILTDSNNKEACKWTTSSREESHKCKDLEAGKYTLTELTAPSGYIKAESINFEIDKEGNIYQNGKKVKKITMEDDITVVYIDKLDIADSKYVEGAKLEITDSNGNIVCEEWTTGKDGETTHRCEMLPQGTYILTEKTAPEGYLVAESITFTIGEDGKTYQNGKLVDKIIMYDSKTPTYDIPVPNTLSTRSSILYIIAFAIISGGLYMIKFTLKNEK